MMKNSYALVTFLVIASFAVYMDRAQTEEGDELTAIIGKSCPPNPSPQNTVDGNARCDPNGRKIIACNENHLDNKAWQACYDEVSACRRRALAYNEKVSAYNAWISQCKEADRTRGASKPAANATPAPSSLSDLKKQQAKKAEGTESLERRKAMEVLQVEREYKEEQAEKEREERRKLDEELRIQEENRRRIIRQQLEEERQANYIPPGWFPCRCPAQHSFMGKVVRGVRYHVDNGESCP